MDTNKQSRANKIRIGSLLLSGFAIVLILCSIFLKVYLEQKASEPASFLIKTENYFDYQENLECSAYASAYTIRSMGLEADALTLYEQIPDKNPDGTVNPDILCAFLTEQGYQLTCNYESTLDELKEQICKGVPVIVLVHVSPVSPYLHYVPLVGYDEEKFYIADSLPYMKNADSDYYNREVSVADFETMWDTIAGHFYIAIEKDR